MGKDKEVANFDAKLLFSEGTKSHSLKLKKETKGKDESDPSQKKERNAIEDGIIVSKSAIPAALLIVVEIFNNWVPHKGDTVFQVVEGISKIGKEDDENAKVIDFKPPFAEFLFKGTAVKVGVTEGVFFKKSFRIHYVENIII